MSELKGPTPQKEKQIPRFDRDDRLANWDFQENGLAMLEEEPKNQPEKSV
jgi:hypothetical protein